MEATFACFCKINDIEFDTWNQHVIIKTKYGNFRILRSSKSEFEKEQLCIFCEVKFYENYTYPMIFPESFIRSIGYLNFDLDVLTLHWIDECDNNELLYTVIEDTDITKMMNCKIKQI
jgi:hypothetical protein